MLTLHKQNLSRAFFLFVVLITGFFQSSLSGKICEQRDQSKALTIRFNDYGEQKIGRHQGSYFYTKDHLGSVRELVGWWGTLQAQYDYSPYGRRHELYSNQGRGTTVGFTGHYRHWVGGIMLAKHRAYFPNIGRWLSPDPMEQVTGSPAELLPEGSNLYAYAANDPINNWDPDGLEVRAYSSPAFGILSEARHLFFYSDVPGVRGVGTSMSLPGSGVPINFDHRVTTYPSTLVNLPAGMTDKQFIEGVRSDKGFNAGIYMPGKNDCHTQAVNAAARLGAKFQKPTSRFIGKTRRVLKAIYRSITNPILAM